MELDKKAIKALSSDTRIEIIKSLGDRRKMPTELAKEMKLAGSTVTSHLKQLEQAGLVNRRMTGHKWIYYELSKKGSNIVSPTIPIHLIVGLVVGIVFVASGGLIQYAIDSGVSFGYSAGFGENILIDSQLAKGITNTTPKLISDGSASDQSLRDVREVPEEKEFPVTEMFFIAFITIGSLLIAYSLGRLYYRRGHPIITKLSDQD